MARTVSRPQLPLLLAECAPRHAGSESAAEVLERLAAYGLGEAPLRTWAITLLSQVRLAAQNWSV